MCNYYSYMRISTKEERGKQGYSRQEKALEKWAEQNKIEFTLDFKEDESGKSFDNRLQWQKLEKIVQSGDTIVFKDICRFTRECKNGLNKYISLMNQGINLIFLDNPTVNTDYIKSISNTNKSEDNVLDLTLEYIAKLLLTVELDRAEKERTTLSQRTKDGMKARKQLALQNGKEWHCGRPKGKLDKITDELKEDIKLFITDRSIKQVDLMKKHNISRNTLKKYVELLQSGELE